MCRMFLSILVLYIVLKEYISSMPHILFDLDIVDAAADVLFICVLAIISVVVVLVDSFTDFVIPIVPPVFVSGVFLLLLLFLYFFFVF